MNKSGSVITGPYLEMIKKEVKKMRSISITIAILILLLTLTSVAIAVSDAERMILGGYNIKNEDTHEEWEWNCTCSKETAQEKVQVKDEITQEFWMTGRNPLLLDLFAILCPDDLAAMPEGMKRQLEKTQSRTFTGQGSILNPTDKTRWEYDLDTGVYIAPNGSRILSKDHPPKELQRLLGLESDLSDTDVEILLPPEESSITNSLVSQSLSGQSGCETVIGSDESPDWGPGIIEHFLSNSFTMPVETLEYLQTDDLEVRQSLASVSPPGTTSNPGALQGFSGFQGGSTIDDGGEAFQIPVSALADKKSSTPVTNDSAIHDLETRSEADIPEFNSAPEKDLQYHTEISASGFVNGFSFVTSV